MQNLSYKVMVDGSLKPYFGKKPASRLSEELPMTFAERHRLRHQVDRKMVVAAKLIFGRKYVPADINEVVAQKELVLQALKDSPGALVLVYHMTAFSGRFSATPVGSVIKRLKDVFMRKGYVVPQRGLHGGLTPGRTRDGRIRKLTDVNIFWDHYAEKPALTEAGWRYLLRLPFETKSKLCELPWYFYRHLGTLNLLAELQFKPVDAWHFEVARFAVDLLNRVDSKRNFLLALRNAMNSGHVVDAAEEDYIKDLVSESRDLVIRDGTAWNTLVSDAAEFLASKAEESRETLAAMQWAVPFPEFTTSTQVTVRPLANGVELLEEGIEMKNCLRNMTHYAKRAMAGESLVMSMRGAYKGTVEYIVGPGGWSLEQVAVTCNQKVFEGPLWKAAQETLRHLQKETA